ncbi:hypothetical protein D5S18_06065 [Nocardia panacis]|uniref:Pyoverdine/dityrosine biosynthesis protein n=1 Tax=Nocardia panacis TaxID=2340916 RepID=A0A3A4L6P6_9NOCA|nr:hypothetical protein D5S18_06065 [Nocardia panacis]
MLSVDPVLRLYCALDATFPDSPSPCHPAYPGGTLAVALDAVPWSHTVEHRPALDQSAYSHVMDRVALPLVRVFRTLLDRYGLVAVDGALAVELSSDLALTGRVVLRDQAGVGRLSEASDDEKANQALVARGVRVLCELLSGLVRQVESARLSLPRSPGSTAALVEHVGPAELNTLFEGEFRFLRPETEKLLRGTDLGRHAHSVSTEQDAVLRQVLDRVTERAVARRRDPGLSPATVLIDLDFCAMVPHERVLAAAQQVAGVRAGAPNGIVELASPESLPILPCYAAAGWEHFLELTGLRRRYPEVDWAEVHLDFYYACFLPWERLRSDSLTPGLVRFVRAVERNGGAVVFNTARRDRTRAHTRHVLDSGGLLTQRVLTTPDSHQRSAPELKVENLGKLTDPYVVAVFDDLTDNREALAVEAPDAIQIAVELPGFTSDRARAERPRDGAAVVAGFEMLPRPVEPAGEPPVPALSHVRIVDRLPLADLSNHPIAAEHGVRLTEADALALIEQLMSVADREAEAAVAHAERNLHRQLRAVDDEAMRTVTRLHHMLTRRQFCRGPSSSYPLEIAVRDMLGSVSAGEPITMVLPGLPIKQCRNRLKAVGPLPDLAELGFLIRLRELWQAMRRIHEPGIRVHILTDGLHFQRNPPALVHAYSQHIRRYVHMIGMAEVIDVSDMDEVAARRLGPRILEQRDSIEAGYRDRLWDAFAGLDIATDPVGTVELIVARDPSRGWHRKSADDTLSLLDVRSVITSMLNMVATEAPAGVDRQQWSVAVLSDIYNVTDQGASSELLAGRRDVLRQTLDAAVHYVAAASADRALGYERMFSSRVRLTVNTPPPGRCGFAGLGGSELLPWQGTAAVDHHGMLATDFAISLTDRGFLPVFAPMLGARQPWFMVPTPVVHVRDRAHGAQLDSSFAAGIRLRRR